MASFTPRVPPFSIRWYAAGATCPDPVDGDVLLVNHGTPMARALTVGQWVIAHTTDRSLRGYTWLDHAAIVRYVDGRAMVSEMGPRGHELRPLARYRANLYAVVHFDVNDDLRRNALDADATFHGIGYGWAQYPAFILDGATGLKVDLTWGDTVVCSTHVALVGRAFGLVGPRLPESTIPANLAQLLDARPPGERVGV